MKSKKPGRKRLSCDTGGRRLLLDGDVLLWRIGATTEDVSEDIAKIRMNNYIDEILHKSFCSDYSIYLTDSSGNFRMSIYPDYKGNRKQPKPKHYALLKDYLINHEAAIVSWGQEADDALGIYAGENTIVGHNDKDIDQVPGLHYDFTKDKSYEVTAEEGMKKLYTQIILGDKTDNICGICDEVQADGVARHKKGLPQVGPVAASKLLEGCTDEISYQTAILKAYKELLGLSEEQARERVNLTGQLVYIRRQPDEMWSLSI